MSLIFMMQGCRDNGDMSEARYNGELQKLYRDASDAARKKQYEVSDSIGNRLYQLADIEDNDLYRIEGLICMSYSRIENPDINQRFIYLKKAENLIDRVINDTVAAKLYNIMGVSSFENFELSKDYFLKSLQYARKSGIISFEMIAECNLAEVYRRSDDTLGIVYDLDIREFARKTDNKVMLHAATVRCAEYYMKNTETLPKSLEYINEIKDMEGQDFYYHYLKSKWLLRSDSIGKALSEWDRAVESGMITPGYLLTGGRIYQRKGNYEKSEELLQRADSGYAAIDSLNIDRIEIYRLRTENLKHLGETERALRMMECYSRARDSLLEIRNVRDMNSFKVKFETEKKELLISKQKEILKRRNISLAMAGAFLILIVAGFLVYIRRRNHLYRLIVEQHKEFATRQNVYAPYVRDAVPSQTDAMTDKPDNSEITDAGDIEDGSDGIQNNVSDTVSPLNDGKGIGSYVKPENEENDDSRKGMPSPDKSDIIWRAIMMEMEVNRIYADPDITRDTFADRVGTNHTWFTAIIKDRTGKSYTQFMNSWRINEAVRILSMKDCPYNNNELAEYLGFMTRQSFYTAFKQQMGMSPTSFRQTTMSGDPD